MHCLYCTHWNPEDEPRCQRCARRLQVSPARPAPANYAGTYSAAATAAAPAVERTLPPVPEGEAGKVLQFPSVAKPHETKTKSRRQAAQSSDSQAFLDFLPPAPHAPRTLKTSVEAVIYCDAPVATPTHRAVGFALDFSLVV